MDSVTLQVPATTANLGPGYDCLGVALQIYNKVTVKYGAGIANTMVAHTAEEFFAFSSVKPFPFEWHIEGEVPQSRGLGSSVTVRLGILCGLNELAGSPLIRQQLFFLCSELEGHPDNTAPACFGGFTVATKSTCQRFDVRPELKFILLIPDFEISTREARAVLPHNIMHSAAVLSSANACRITAAFASQNYSRLYGSFLDYGFHQLHRQKLIPFLQDVIAAGEKAGALGGFLSGSGSTICCVTLENPEAIAAAMLAASDQPNARTIITSADNEGVKPSLKAEG